jgi:hypothetical protein
VVIARNFVDGERDTAAAGAGANPALLRRPQGANGTPDWSSRARRHLAATWLIVSIAVIGAGATLLCAGIGYNLADRSDEHQAGARRDALRAATSEFRAVFGTSAEIDPRFVRMIEQSTALKDLRFESDPAPEGRETQPVLDAQGRIVGFFTWQPERPLTAMMSRLMPLIACIAFGLVGFAGFSVVQLRRARLVLSASESQARRAAE